MPKALKKRGSLLKLAGTAVLLLSFAAQNFFYEASNARSAELLAAMRDRQMIDKGALLQEIMYFSALNSDGKLGDVNASELAAAKASTAAMKVVQSFSIAVNASRSLPPEEATKVIKGAFAEAQRVKDYASLSAFFNTINVALERYDKLNIEYNKEADNRARSRIAYLILYLFGTIVLLLGLYFDWRGAEE